MTGPHGRSVVEFEPLRRIGVIVGGLFLTVGLVGWFPYLGASLTGFGADESGPGATNRQLIGMFFALWIVPWLAGSFLVSIALAGRSRRTLRVLLGLTGVMLAVSLTTCAIG